MNKEIRKEIIVDRVVVESFLELNKNSSYLIEKVQFYMIEFIIEKLKE